MESLGQKLKKARETRGLSLEEIAKVTKISEKSLVLIENGQFQDLPAPTYIKGFIKLYAQCVGLDAASILEEFQKGQVPETKQVLVLDGEKIESPGIWEIIGSSLKASLQVFWAFVRKYLMIALQYFKKVPPKIWAAGGGGFLFVFLLMQFFKPEAPKKESIQNSVQNPVVSVQSPVAMNQKNLSSSSLIRPETTPEVPSENQVLIKQVPETIRSSNVSKDVPSSTASSPLLLEGQVKEAVWLRIYSDQRLVFEGTLKKGARETWKAQDFFRLRIGNPDAIQFSLNGKPLGRIGPPGKIRDIRLTKDGWYISD